MSSYLHVERTINNIISPNEGVIFETIIKDSSELPDEDFVFSLEESEIGIKKCGIYVIQWYLSQMTGLSPIGQVFQLQYKNENDTWTYLGDGTSHIKMSSSNGFGLLEIDDEILKERTDGTTWIRLCNKSDHDVVLSDKNRIKGALVIYELGEKNLNPDGIHAGITWDVNDEMWTESTIGQKITNGATFPFDLMLSESYYNTIKLIELGIFEINKAGKYKVSWEIPINTIDYAKEAIVALFINGNPYSYAHLPTARGIINATAIFDVWFDQEVDIQLINLSGCTLRLGRHSNLTISYLCPPSKG